ncbi:MAG: hypothetical protein GY797_20845 [Deltaproteobacteria bacterium]|nr:hypothetical protein [Deltaproteobacteria bacterium]
MNDLVATINSLFGILSCLSMPALMGILAYAGYYAINQNQNKQFDLWKIFAENNDLTYKSSKFFPSIIPQVKGIFRGYKLTLSAFSQAHYPVGSDHNARRNPQLFTRMVLQTEKVRKNDISLKGKSDEKYVKTFLNSASLHRLTAGDVYAEKRGSKVVYEQKEIEQYDKNLGILFESIYNLIETYPMIVAIGGKIVPNLQSIGKNNQALQQVMGQLLFDIGQTTKKQLKHHASELLCSVCLVHCSAHKINAPWHIPVTYFGCRACGQSRNFLETKKRNLIAVLDNSASRKMLETETTIRVNWLSQRKVFDFDEVEIHQVTDREVELFAIQAGNDTDPIRRPRYKKMRCRLSTDCRLSENTMRILHQRFGKVIVEELVHQ